MAEYIRLNRVESFNFQIEMPRDKGCSLLLAFTTQGTPRQRNLAQYHRKARTRKKNRHIIIRKEKRISKEIRKRLIGDKNG